MENQINPTDVTASRDLNDVAQAASVPATHVITLDQLVTIAIEQDASDIHFTENGRVALRIGGKFVFIENIERLPSADTQAMIEIMLPTEAERKRLQTMRELDFSYIHTSGVSFRVNLFYSRGNLSTVMRMISKHVPSMEELGIPQIMKQFLSLREGLILVTGPTGSGKSTSIQAMLEYVNQNFVYHVITIENPIEHVFKNGKSIFSQRELGKDTLSFSNAIRSATREDPNLIMVSEIRDRETMDAVLSLVEMGHLVIASMSTKNAMQTLEHVISLYPHSEQNIMLDRFADSLLGILSQDLLDRADQPGRVAVYEFLMATKGMKNIIRYATLSQLRTGMEADAQQGTITMDNYAYQLEQRGYISKEDAAQYQYQID